MFGIFSLKTFIIKILIAIWVIFSLGYIGYDVWSDFKIKKISEAYQVGKNEMIDQLIQQAENKECQSFTVFKDAKKIALINLDCLKQTQESKKKN